MNLRLFILINIIIFYSCNFLDDTTEELDSDGNDNSIEQKNYSIDSDGQIITTEFNHNDFNSAHDCMECHQQHFDEWNNSMHAHSFKAPLFISLLNGEIQKRPETGQNFCLQCHAPVAYLSNYEMPNINSTNDLNNLPESISQGITCTVCHVMVNTSSTVFTPDNAAAVIDDYHLNPGQNIFYGSIEFPDSNSFHDSQYLPFYSQSESCLPCHDQLIRGKEIETTFTEWQRIPGFGMSGAFPCQECHMPITEDGHRDHTFASVDVNLDSPYDLYAENLALLQTAVGLEFNFESDSLNLTSGNTIAIPIIVESFTGHRFPTGTSFGREAWIEISISSNDSVIFQSGKINHSEGESLNINDESLLLFTTWLLDENNDTTFSASDTYDFINNSLPALEKRNHTYNLTLEEDFTSIDIEMKMIFRALKPEFFNESNNYLINTIPVYEIASTSKTIFNYIEINQ